VLVEKIIRKYRIKKYYSVNIAKKNRTEVWSTIDLRADLDPVKIVILSQPGLGCSVNVY